MGNYFVISHGLNIAIFDRLKEFKLDDYPDLKSSLHIFPNGDIYGISREIIYDVLNDPEVKSIRNGFKNRPNFMDIKTPNDFLRVIALYIDLIEY
jgi:hypothetical protein